MKQLLEDALAEAWMIHVGGYVRHGRMVRPHVRSPRVSGPTRRDDGAHPPPAAAQPIDVRKLKVGDLLIDSTHRRWRIHQLQPVWVYETRPDAPIMVHPEVGSGRTVIRKMSRFVLMAPGRSERVRVEARDARTAPRTLKEWADIGAQTAVRLLEFDPDQPRAPAGREGGGRWVKKARLSGALFHVSPEFHRDDIRAGGLLPPERVPGGAGGIDGEHGQDRPDHAALVRDPDAVYFVAKRGVSEHYAKEREQDGQTRRMFSTYGSYPNTSQDVWEAVGVPLDTLAPDHESFADHVLTDFFSAQETGEVWDIDNEYRNISAGADTLGTYLRYRGMDLLKSNGLWPMEGSRYSLDTKEMFARARDERAAAILLLRAMPPDLRTAVALRWAEEGLGVMVYGGVPKSRVKRAQRMYEAMRIAEQMLEQL